MEELRIIPQKRNNPKIEITPEQKEYLLENYQAMKMDDLAKHFKVSVYKVKCWLNEMGVVRQRIDSYSITKKPERLSEFFEHDPNLSTI